MIDYGSPDIYFSSFGANQPGGGLTEPGLYGRTRTNRRIYSHVDASSRHAALSYGILLDSVFDRETR